MVEKTMSKKELYMIGNSHIDPVWFWGWEEGMQEVKATYQSALDRMKEFQDFKFTSTSTAFFEWIERLLPEMFQEIKQRVEEGRWEITGGWFIEPDCILPCGEAFVRQGLYGQRYLKSRFGKECKIGSNVDSFGHNHILPQILKKSGMDSYVFMRPRLNTPVFVWESDDGSRVNAISLPGEYTAWFHEPTVKNIQDTLDRTKGYSKMPCCYGVGNHGGGPTIENIKSIQALQDSFIDAHLKFSTYTEFFQDIQDENLVVKKGPFEKVNEGCYSIDSPFKALNRLAEKRLIEADSFMSMASALGCGWMEETKEIQNLWKVLLFNQFHDTLGGTIIKDARDEAAMQVSGVCAKAELIKGLAIQNIANQINTDGCGFPLFLFHAGNGEYKGIVEVELEWFCQAPLKILNNKGEEIPYQRIHTDAKVRHTTLGGRRRILFQAEIPSFGFAVYRVVKDIPQYCYNNNMEIEDANVKSLENQYLKAVFDLSTGQLSSLIDKETGYDALKGNSSIRVYVDERDAWGGIQGRKYEDLNQEFHLVSIDKVESGKIREAIRVRLRYKATKLEQIYYLGSEDRVLTVENRLIFNQPWTLLKIAYDTGEECNRTLAETAYGTLERVIQEDASEFYMQRFLDVSSLNGSGLAIANNGKYAFNMTEGRTQITLCRSAIYAQGNGPDWYNEAETYRYTDIGEQTFWLALRPHGKSLRQYELYKMAEKISGAYEYLEDNVHVGKQVLPDYSMVSADKTNVEVVLVKKCEDDNSYIIRLLETQGVDTRCNIMFNGKKYPVMIGHHEIFSLKVNDDTERAKEVNLLEWRKEEYGK